MKLKIDNLHYQNSWEGYHSGYDDIDRVALYTSYELKCDFLINAENLEVLEVRKNKE